MYFPIWKLHCKYLFEGINYSISCFQKMYLTRHVPKYLIRIMLRPGNSQEKTTRDSPQSMFPTSPWLLGVGHPTGLRFGYRRSSNKNKKPLPVRPSPPCIFLYFLTLSMICKFLSKMQIDQGCKEWSQCDVQVLTSHLRLSRISNHTQLENTY